MLLWLKQILTRPKSLRCGGERCCAVVDHLGREVAQLWYNAPTANDILQYTYELQTGLAAKETRLDEIQSAKNKPLKCHEILWRDLTLPWARKIFTRAAGYMVDGKKIDLLSGERQLEVLEKYYAHNLTDMVSIAFQVQSAVKKKD